MQVADFVACHQFNLLEKFDVLRNIREGGVFLLNSPYGKDETFSKLPSGICRQIIDKKLDFYVIDGYKVAREAGMGSRVNTIMQTCFFAISGVLPKEEAIEQIRKSIKKTYGSKGEEVVKKNFAAVEKTLENLFKVDVSGQKVSDVELRPAVSENAPVYVRNTLSKIISGRGDDVAVSEMPVDGTFASGTAQWEKRNIALEVPVWDESICIQCGKCALICPHATIRIKAYDGKCLPERRSRSSTQRQREKSMKTERNTQYRLQLKIAPDAGYA